MTPETFNAQLAQRKLEAADILLKQAKTGSDADRIRAASAILRIAFFPIPARATDRLSAAGRCSTPKTSDTPSAPNSTSSSGAPESPQQSEEIPRESPADPISPRRADAPAPELPTSGTPQSLRAAATPQSAPITPPPEPVITGYCSITGRALYSP